MKKVSVIIPAYNKSNLTVRTVHSVLNQSYNNIEIIVVDDGSRDDTREKMAGFGDKIRYIYKENGGACSSRNRGIKEASGELIALLDCDDIYYPDKIKNCVSFLENNADIQVVFTAANYIDSDDKAVFETKRTIPPDQQAIRNDLLLTNIFCNSTIVAYKACFDETGLFDESIFIPADWDMWIRLSECCKIGYLDENLTGYRITDSYTNANLGPAIDEAIYVLDKALKRNRDISEKLIRYSQANIFSGHGLAFAATGNISAARKNLWKSLQCHPANIKILIYFGIACLFPFLLQRIVMSRNPIYHYSIKKKS